MPADTPVYGEKKKSLDFADEEKISEEPPVGVLGQLMKIFGIGGLGVGALENE